AFGGSGDIEPKRHPPDQGSEHSRGEHRGQRRNPGRQAKDGQQDEEEVERDASNQRRKRDIAADRIVDLMKREDRQRLVHDEGTSFPRFASPIRVTYRGVGAPQLGGAWQSRRHRQPPWMRLRCGPRTSKSRRGQSCPKRSTTTLPAGPRTKPPSPGIGPPLPAGGFA